MIPVASAVWRERRWRGPVRIDPAVRLAGILLLIASAMLAGPWVLAGIASLVGTWLHAQGLDWRRLPALGGPWLGFGLVILVIHALTATDIAPLGHPTLTGLSRGLLILARLAVVLAVVGAATRALPVDDLVAALAWWLRPLRPLGLDATTLGLGVAVALGTVPRVRAEAQRLLACQRLRRPPGHRSAWDWLQLRLRVIPPLIDGLMRRAETLPLVVVWRLPAAPPPPASPRAWQWAPLVAWLGILVWLA